MGAILQIAGLAGSYVGILTMLRYDLPYHLPPLPALVRAMSASEASEEDRRNLIGCGGILLFTVGAAFQIMAVLMK